ncbi:MAG: hypothetical protein ACRCSF_09265 [Mycobacteriaceae bacterium]
MVDAEMARVGVVAYINALVSHKSDEVPFADNCTRTELGIRNGFSGKHLRRSLNRGLQYRAIKAVRKLTLHVDGDTVYSHYIVDTRFPGLSAQVTEDFYINESGQIAHIRAKFRIFYTSLPPGTN